MTLPGQTGIRLREALAAGDWESAAALAPTLDEAHRIELLLGAAIRDAREGWAAARAWLDAEAARGAGSPDSRGGWAEVCRLLATGTPDHTLDELAAGYIAEGRVSGEWRPRGKPLDRDVHVPLADVAVAAAYADGVAGEALLDAFAGLPLYPAVAHYYRRGTIHALGPRPLLVLAASAPPGEPG